MNVDKQTKGIDYCDLQKAVADYYRRGWNVIPCSPNKKSTSLRTWKRWQKERIGDSNLDIWFRKPLVNVAINCGDVSGGLVVRDFDDANAYANWKKRHPELYAILPTVKTAKGFHVYARMEPCPRLTVTGVEAGELRANGAYVLAPPSIHPDGTHYQWVTKPSTQMPIVTFDDFDLGHLANRSGCMQHSQHSQHSKPSQPSNSKSTQVIGEDRSGFVLGDYDSAIRESLPKVIGERNRCLFDLARRIKSVDERQLPAERLVEIFDLWWKEAVNVISTKDPGTSLDDFLRSYETARTPYGDTMFAILQTANANGFPEWVPNSLSLECKQLAGLCRQLQREHGENPFFLSVHTAGQLLEVDPTHAGAGFPYLNDLRRLRRSKMGASKLDKHRRFVTWATTCDARGSQ